MNLLIVESPGKITKLKKILGRDWQIKATFGHFRKLKNNGEGNLGFDLTNGRVNCRFEIQDARSKKVVKELRSAASKAKQIYVASDPDREGEVIAWHVYEVLKTYKNKLVRVSYVEITEGAVKSAIARPRGLDYDLIGAGLARSCLDKLVGFGGSPLVWSLGAKSVGRVQSAVLHLVCDRETEIFKFQPQDYYLLTTEYLEGYIASYFAESNGSEETRIYIEAEAKKIAEVAKSYPHQVVSVEQTQKTKKPPLPFITSSLQQVAGNKLGISPDQTMKLAQNLYEKGLITYMRTDAAVLSDDFFNSAIAWLKQKDPNNVAQQQNYRGKKGKNAQEAHEAIRPSDIFYPSEKLKQEIATEEFKLYVLIWKRAIATVCRSAILNQTSIVSRSYNTYWKAKGQTVYFSGYLKYWHDIDAENQLPQVREGQELKVKTIECQPKRTSPPPRYSEPQLVALMEKLGIGRPSTYSSSIKTLKIRTYLKLSKKKLFPTELGQKVDDFMGTNFSKLVDSKFTSQMELSLDAVANGQLQWQSFLSSWNSSYFAPTLFAAKGKVEINNSKKSLPSKAVVTDFICPICQQQLNQYSYQKNHKEKKLLRCSTHKEAVFFKTKSGKWWNKELGCL